MKRSFSFYLNDDEKVSISLSIYDLINLPIKIQNPLFVEQKYYVIANVEKESLQNFLTYLIDKSKIPEVTVKNACDYDALLKEVDIIDNFIPDEILKMSYLYKAKMHDTEYVSSIEEYISNHLQYFLMNHEDDMSEIPITSLRNIFFNPNRQLDDEEIAYHFITKFNNPSLYILLSSLSFDKLLYKSRNESLEKIDERYGFMPKMNYLALQEHENLFYKLYVANIKNRLNEITNPSKEDRIRWVMELVQNAKDSLYILTNESDIKRKVTVKFEFILNEKNEKKVIFKHNGPPFSIDSYYGLIYKISEGKNKVKTTGKFGTGFLTTHVLSKTVKISGTRIEKNNDKTGFSITMIREGKENEEIINDIIKMQDTFRKIDPSEWTTFEYGIKTELSLKCAKLGLDHFKMHAFYVLINCDDIESFNVKENEVEKVYSVQKVEEIEDGIENSNHKTNEFISLYKGFVKNKENEILDCKEYIVVNDDSKEISISIEYSDKKIIPKENDQESLYVSFPLVGSSEHILPFCINCHYFEPTTERNALILDEEETFSNTTKVGINRNYLLKSVELFDKLVSYLIENQFSNIYECTRGLIIQKAPYNSFDMKWYNEVFLTRMRSVLSNKAIVKTVNDENILLKNVFIPAKEIEDEFIQEFVNLSTTKKFYPKMICTNDCLIWRDKIWDTFNYVNIDQLIGNVIKDEEIVKEENLTSLNELIKFIFKYKKELLDKFPLIPDMNGDLHCLNEKYFRKSNTVSDKIIDIMQDISLPWKSTHMNKKINETILGNEISEDKIADAEKEIIEKIKQDKSQSLNLMKYVLKNDQHRNDMFYFVHELGMEKSNSIIINDEIDPSIWELADDVILRKIVEEINSQKRSIDLNFFKRFIPVFKNHFANDDEFINSSKVIPTANNGLDCLNNLTNKSDVFHDHLNEIMMKISKRKFNFNNNIIHPEINLLIKSKKDENIIELLEKINEIIKTIVQKEEMIEAAQYVISIVPQKDDNALIDQNLIFKYYQKLIKPDLKEISIQKDKFDINQWAISNKIIVKEISQYVEKAKNLDDFLKMISPNGIPSEENAFEILNFLYKFEFLIDNNKHPIVPNRYGEFKTKSMLKTNPGIDSEFFTLLSSLCPEKQLDKEIVHHKVKIDGLIKFDIQEFFRNLTNIMVGFIENPQGHEDKVDEIKKFLSFEVFKFSNLSDEGINDKIKLLKNTHISFIYNRIKEIKSSSIFDYQRWPFELIQNATDCIQKEEENHHEKNGEIEFEFNDNQVIFTHYGASFTNENLISLLYQYGGGKEGTKSIGRFGTGFLSTLVLSRIAQVSSDLEYVDKGTKTTTGFTLIINRQGDTMDDLKKGIEIMEQDMKEKMKENIKNKTTFIFQGDVKSNKELKDTDAYKEGYNGLKNNIPQTLVFNPKIKSITLKLNNKDQNEELIFIRKLDDNKQIKTIEIKSLKETIQRSFIYGETKDIFEYHNKSINIKKNVNINCIIEIGSKNKNIIPNKEFLYLAFPIFGSKPFNSPIIINSLEFEPKKERDDIIVQLDDKNKDSYEAAINKFIISKSVFIFKQIIEIALKTKCTNLFNFSYGINTDSENKYFQSNFVEEMRKIFKLYPIFETEHGYKKYHEILIPYIKDYSEFLGEFNSKDDHEKEIRNEKETKIYTEFLNLVSKIDINPNFINNKLNYGKGYFVKSDICCNWIQLIWSSFESLIGIEDLLKFIQSKNRIDDLLFIENNNNSSYKISFINDVIEFLFKSQKKLYYINNFNILINKKNNFVGRMSLNQFDNSISKEIICLLDDVKYDYLKDIIHQDIKLFKEFNLQLFDIKKAINLIKDNINQQNYLYLMKFDTGEVKRNRIYDLSIKYLKKDIEKIKFSIPSELKKNYEEMFKRADDIVFSTLIEKMQNEDIKMDNDDNLIFVRMLDESGYPYKDKKIFPNQLLQLHKLYELKKDLIIDENIKNVIKDVINSDIREFLIDDSFSNFISSNYGLFNLSGMVEDFIDKHAHDLKDSDFIKICSIVLSNYTKTADKTIEEIANLVNFFYKQNIKVNQYDKSSYFTNKLVIKIEELAIKTINKFISSVSNISELGFEQNKLFEYLPTLYLYSHKFKCSQKIYPNNQGVLMEFNQIQIVFDQQIETDLLNQLYQYLTKFNNSITDYSNLHKSIKISNDLYYIIKDKIFNLQSIRNEILKYPIIQYYTQEIDDNSSNDKKLKKSISEDFIKFIKSNYKFQVLFSKLLSEVDSTLPSDIFENKRYFSGIAKVKRLMRDFEKTINLSKIMNDEKNKANIQSNKIHFMKTVIYDIIQKNNSFMNQQTNICNDVNKADDSDQEYDFYAEDEENHKFYFVIKTIQVKTQKLKFSFKEMEFLVNLNEDEYFVIILISDSYNVQVQLKGKM